MVDQPDSTVVKHDALDAIVADGLRWQQHHDEAFRVMPVGTTVIIDRQTGQYTAAETWVAAREAFDLRFGAARDSFSFIVGRPVFIGGGMCRD